VIPAVADLIAHEQTAAVFLLVLLLALLWPAWLKPTAAGWRRLVDASGFVRDLVTTVGTFVLAIGWEAYDRLRGQREKPDPDILTPEGPASLRDRQK
jgi:hypothetical protein